MTKKQCINNYLEEFFPTLQVYNGISLITYGTNSEDWVEIWYGDIEDVVIYEIFYQHLKNIFPFTHRLEFIKPIKKYLRRLLYDQRTSNK